jgi:hypothetical protein
MSKRQKISTRRFCSRCRVHGIQSDIRGHRGSCLFAQCQCDACQIQSYANKISLKERRMQKICDEKASEMEKSEKM